jgi:DNA excision repair protein ERCC-3
MAESKKGDVASRAKQRYRELQKRNEDDEEEVGLQDFSSLPLKADHAQRPLWVCPDGAVFLEASSSLYAAAYDFLVAVAEPVARPEHVHQYKLTPHSLYAAVAVGITPASICDVLDKLSKVKLPEEVKKYILQCTKNFGRAKLVLRDNRHHVESGDAAALRELLAHRPIRNCRDELPEDGDRFEVGTAQQEIQANRAYLDIDIDGDSSEEEEKQVENINALRTYSFRLKQGTAQDVKKYASQDLDFPLAEEYDFRRDPSTATLPIDLRPSTKIRNYQEKSLSKMFGNGRARSGIIVLPCGAGKTLTAIVAASTVKRSVLVLCTNATAVSQWKAQFALWTTLPASRVSLFTAEVKEDLHPECGVLITTYHMVTFSGKRSVRGEELIKQVREREWGLMLLDEVHVVPAQMFRKVLSSCNAHCKLGLTATLVREDDLITDLNFLIGPKLYEANWMDLTHAGHLANVQCVEVWCPMTAAFYREYLRHGGAGLGNKESGIVVSGAGRTRRLLYVLNPTKFRACEYLVHFHEKRGDKVIVFSDDVFALLAYARALERPAIYGATKESERQAVLGSFRFNPLVNTVCLSKVGDVAIDLPEANVIVQVSSHFGSRRQEAQRLGRILRPKASAEGGGFNAFFYTLVSTDTTEMFYSTKRQQYLVDQGYTFKVVTDLPQPTLSALASEQDEIDLLNQVLNADALKEEAEEEKALAKAAKDDIAPRRTQVSLASMAGGDGVRYLEYGSTDAPKQKPKRHKLFRGR